VVSLPTDPSLVELCEAIATAEPAFGARPVRAPLGSDALAARLRRFRSTTIRGLDSGLPPRWQHAPDDTPEHVDSDAMDRATGFVSALVRLLDRDAGRASQAAPARETV